LIACGQNKKASYENDTLVVNGQTMFMWQITRLKSTYKTEKQTIMSSQDKKMWKQNRNQKLFHALCEAPGSRNNSKKAIENTISK